MRIYLKAAKLLVRKEADMCYEAIMHSEYEAIDAFNKWFKPAVKGHSLWFGPVNEKTQLTRSLALLFMHEIDKDGDL